MSNWQIKETAKRLVRPLRTLLGKAVIIPPPHFHLVRNRRHSSNHKRRGHNQIRPNPRADTDGDVSMSGVGDHSGVAAWSTAPRRPSYSIDVSDATIQRLWQPLPAEP